MSNWKLKVVLTSDKIFYKKTRKLYVVVQFFFFSVAAEALPDKRPLLRRGGRQQLETGYGAPAPAAEGYGAPDYEEPEVLDVRSEELSSYNEERSLDTYGDNDALASELDAKSADPGLDMLMKAIPGIPGEDYPILSSAPETAFSCDGQVNGGEKKISTGKWRFFFLCTTLSAKKLCNA